MCIDHIIQYFYELSKHHRIAPDVKEQILKRVRDEAIPVSQAAKEHGVHDQKQHKTQREDIRRKYENCMKAMQNLVSLYVSAANGDKSLLSDDELRKQKDSLAAERDRYKALLDENERNADSALDQTIRIFDFAQNALMHFDSPDTDVALKREILTTIGSNWKLFRGLVNREATFPYFHIQEGVEAHRKLLSRPEPALVSAGRAYKGDSPLSESEISIWWPRPGSNW